jgi:hypothetical protein
MNNNEYSIIMTRIITLELLSQGNLDSSRGDNQGSHIPAAVKNVCYNTYTRFNCYLHVHF